MTGNQYFIAGGISLLALGLILLRIICPQLPIDTITLGFFGIAVLPWLTLFYKKIKLPGGIETESVEGKVSVPRMKGMRLANTKELATPVEDEHPNAIQFKQLSEESKKILRTLWKYQTIHFGDDRTKRWTFALSPLSPLFSRICAGTRTGYSQGLGTT